MFSQIFFSGYSNVPNLAETICCGMHFPFCLRLKFEETSCLPLSSFHKVNRFPGTERGATWRWAPFLRGCWLSTTKLCLSRLDRLFPFQWQTGISNMDVRADVVAKWSGFELWKNLVSRGYRAVSPLHFWFSGPLIVNTWDGRYSRLARNNTPWHDLSKSLRNQDSAFR